MSKISKQMKPARRLTVFKALRAAFIGFVLFSAVALAPVAEMKYQAFKLSLSHPASGDEKRVYTGRDGRQISADEYALESGYERAREKKITRHADCKTSFKGMPLVGCEKYVTEHKGLPPHVKQGDWDQGKTTAQCRMEVERYWTAVTRDELEKNGPDAMPPWTRRDWAPELKSCDNYDRIHLANEVTNPLYRLDAILHKLDGGSLMTEQDRETVRRDTVTVQAFPDNPQRKEYLDKVEKFNVYADHQH